MSEITDRPDRIEGTATVTLPEGMTQEEADRLVREAEEARQKAEPT